MTITRGAGRTTGLLAASLLVASGLAGCGSGQTAAACTKVRAELTNAGAQGTNTGDPKAVKVAYERSAAKIRAAAKGTDIAEESERVAAAMEKLGQNVFDMLANPTSAPGKFDSAELINAGTALQKACS